MNHSYIIIILIFAFNFFVSCGEQNEQNSNSKLRLETVDSTTLIAPKTHHYADVDKNFEAFLYLFNSDSLFQISCIVFPLKFKELYMEIERGIVEGRIEKSDFQKFDFTYDQSISKRAIDAYTQDVEINGDKATLVIRGVDNGIAADYFFEKRNGKWMLIYFEDHST